MTTNIYVNDHCTTVYCNDYLRSLVKNNILCPVKIRQSLKKGMKMQIQAHDMYKFAVPYFKCEQTNLCDMNLHSRFSN